MDYAQQQRNPGKHLSGFMIVVVLHVVLGWALLNGLARKIVEVVKAPIETKIIDEVKPPPPPPPENLPPPPKTARTHCRAWSSGIDPSRRNVPVG